jgi:hypothetical protein
MNHRGAPFHCHRQLEKIPAGCGSGHIPRKINLKKLLKLKINKIVFLKAKLVCFLKLGGS